jgi:cobalt-zinc-cadmium efflux system protein
MAQHTHHLNKHHHTHHHGHSHHGHSHAHATGNIAVAFFLNTTFALIELIGGLLTNSVAILSDALHDLGDSLSLGTAWYFQRKSQKTRTTHYTYGYKRFSLVGAFVNAIVLTVGSVFIIQEAISRLSEPQQPNPQGMIGLGILGILVNGVAMLRLKKGDSINERVVSLHFLEDVLGWVAVLIGAVIMLFAHVPILDPILSLGIAAFVLFNVYLNIKPAFQILLQGVPEGVSEEEVRWLVLMEKDVVDVHDYHLWTLDGEHHILTLHVVVNDSIDLKQAEALKERIKSRLHELDITHATIEVEFNPEHCQQRSC